MQDIINLITGRKSSRKQVLVMTSPEWKKWVAAMYDQFPSDVAAKAIEITAQHQRFQDAK